MRWGILPLVLALSGGLVVHAEALSPPDGATSADGTWSPLTSYGYVGTAVYDSSSDRVLLVSFDRIWAWDAAGLNSTELRPVTDLVPGGGRTSVYDPIQNRLIYIDPANNAVWQVTLGENPTASQIMTAGFGPPSEPSYLEAFAAVFDAGNNRILVFGGSQFCACSPIPFYYYYNATWALDFSAGTPIWSVLATSGSPPSPRAGANAIYDPLNRRMLVFGGGGENDVYSLSLTGTPTWQFIATSTPKPSSSRARALFRPSQGTMVIAGGIAGVVPDDIWELTTTGTSGTWTQHAASGGSPDVLDTRRDRLVDFYSVFTDPRSSGVQTFDLVSNAWTAGLQQASPTPMNSGDGRYLYDAQSGNIFMLSLLHWILAGSTSIPGPGELWSLSPSGSWARLQPGGTRPSPRGFSKMILDPIRHRIVVYGGADSTGWRGDVWALDLAGAGTWSQLAAIDTPTDSGSAAVYDPADDRMIVLRLVQRGSEAVFDVWALSFANLTWSHQQPMGTPPVARPGAVYVYDPPRHRILMLASDAGYALRLSPEPTWTNLQTVIPTGAMGPYVYDPVADRLIGGPTGALWQMTLTDPPVWQQLHPTGVRDTYREALVFDTDLGRLVSLSSSLPNWIVTFGSPVSAPSVSPPVEAALAQSVPNPATNDATIRFALPVSGRVEMTLFDLAGRRVRRLVDATLPAGSHSVIWDRRDDAGARVPPGVYSYALHTGTGRLVRRMVVVQ